LKNDSISCSRRRGPSDVGEPLEKVEMVLEATKTTAHWGVAAGRRGDCGTAAESVFGRAS